MKTYVVNAFLKKGTEKNRKNFTIQSDSEDESSLISLILAKVTNKQDKWVFKQDKFELIKKESVIVYEIDSKKNNSYMKFLKLFESKYYDEFEKLKQITGVDEIEDDIKDTIQELIDDFNFFRFNNPQTLLQLTYQRKVKRTTSIGLDYYQKIIKEISTQLSLQ